MITEKVRSARWPYRTPMQRWAAKVRLPEHWKEEACWEWTGGTNGVNGGYGVFMDSERGVKPYRCTMAYRYAYERFVGPIPEGMVLDHICRNHNCVNPMHLDPCTRWENILRGKGGLANAMRTGKCSKGHELSGDNLAPVRGRGRICKVCALERTRKSYQSKPLDAPIPLLTERHKTHCKQGHELSGANLYTWRGRRACRACRYLANKNRYQKKR